VSVHEPPLREYALEAQAVDAAVCYGISEHQRVCPAVLDMAARRASGEDRCCGCPHHEPSGSLSLTPRTIRDVPRLDLEDVPLVLAQARAILSATSATRPPVSTNVVGILDPGHLVMIREATLCYRGDCQLDGDQWVIQVNRELGTKPRRFVIMRQGFHILRESGRMELRSSGLQALDWLADRFAAAMLMPEAWVREMWPRTSKNLVSTAGIFQVSPTAMKIRLRELGLS
jgi:hypothetical protein